MLCAYMCTSLYTYSEPRALLRTLLGPYYVYDETSILRTLLGPYYVYNETSVLRTLLGPYILRI